MPPFLEIVKTILLLLITACTAYIAYRMYRTNEAKAKVSMYEKRLGIYQEVMRLLGLITRDGDVSSEELTTFRSKTSDSNFLFDKDLAEYIDEIHSRSLKLRATNDRLKSAALPIGEERDRVTVENSKQLIWLADQLPRAKKKFENYLQMQEE